MMRRGRIALTLILLASAVTAATPGGARAATTKRWVMGYYVGYQRSLMPAKDIDWAAMTHLVVGPVNPRADGTLDTALDIGPAGGPALAKDLAKRAKAHDVAPLLMIGGAGMHDNFLAAARNHRAALVDHLVALMKDYGYRGLDLDWEPISASDQPYVTALVKDLRARLPHALLTMPVMWITKTFPTVPKFYGRLARRLDRISVMSYGMAGPWSGWRTWHSSALHGATGATPSSVDVNVRSFERAGVPAAKLGVGIGFYGSCWTGAVTGPRQPVGSSTIAADDNVMSYVNIVKRYYRASAYHYDTKADAPYLSFPDGHGPQDCTFVSYENARSVAAKARYARSHGLGALIVWTVNQGHLRGAAAGHRDVLLAKARRAFRA
jgi:chitinase